MPETTPLIKAALNLRVGAGFDVYEITPIKESNSVSYLLFSTDFKKIKIFAEI
jgi:hypothetical protein